LLKFLRAHSNYLKTAKEVIFVKETLNATIYKVATASLVSEVVIKVPKKHEK
jgi:hypothetical protein